MKCKYFNVAAQIENTTTVTWRVFFPMCPKINVSQLCNQSAGAYVAAVTVCAQRLF